MASLKTLRHQFRLADEALHQADHLHRAGYWAACISNAYQVALRSAAGLLYGLGLNPLTEREVRVAFAAAFIAPATSDARFDAAFRRLEELRTLADFDHDHSATKEEADEARHLAHLFRDEALRIQKEALK